MRRISCPFTLTNRSDEPGAGRLAVASGRAWRLGALAYLLHGLQEAAVLNRLYQIIHHGQLEGCHGEGLMRCHERNGRQRSGQHPNQFQTREVGHLDVGQQQVGRGVALQVVQRGQPIGQAIGEDQAGG